MTITVCRQNLEHPTLHIDTYDEQARVAKVSILYGDRDPTYERALQTHKVHSKIHGYPFFI